MRWDPSAGCCVKGFDNSPVVSRRILLLADHLRMQMANFGGSKGPRRMLRCGGVIWEGKGVSMAELRVLDMFPASRTSCKLGVSLEVYDFDMC